MLFRSHLNVEFHACTFEASVVAIAPYKSSVSHFGSYYENIGYDVSATGLTTGITDRAFGLADIAGNVSAPVTQRFGKSIFVGGKIGPLFAANSANGFFDGVGLANAATGVDSGDGEVTDANGTITIDNMGRYDPTGRLFRVDATNRGDFEYHVNMPNQRMHYNEDQRAPTSGRYDVQM